MAQADFLEAGSGPLVILIHSSVAGARQWRRLMEELAPKHLVRAVNLFGYGATPPWNPDRLQTLADQAELVETIIPAGVRNFSLVGHSFGGSVAMKLAARQSGRVDRLVLLETNPFYLLGQAGRTEAFAEASELRDWIKKFGAQGEWAVAAERFSDYWNAPGSWESTSAERRATFSEALKPNYFEWDAVMFETTPAEEWARTLPESTVLVSDAKTVRTIREIEEVLRQAAPHWRHRAVAEGGHMAPLTRPDLVNPIVREELEASA